MASGVRRDQRKESFWRRIVDGRKGSGLSVRAWCGRHGVQPAAFYWWRAQLARRDAEAPRFAAVQVLADAAASGAGSAGIAGRIEIVLSGDRRVHIVGRVEPQMLAEVLAVLTEGARGEEARRC